MNDGSRAARLRVLTIVLEKLAVNGVEEGAATDGGLGEKWNKFLGFGGV